MGPIDYQSSVLTTRPQRQDSKVANYDNFIIFESKTEKIEILSNKMYQHKTNFGFTNVLTNIDIFGAKGLRNRQF